MKTSIQNSTLGNKKIPFDKGLIYMVWASKWLLSDGIQEDGHLNDAVHIKTVYGLFSIHPMYWLFWFELTCYIFLHPSSFFFFCSRFLFLALSSSVYFFLSSGPFSLSSSLFLYAPHFLSLFLLRRFSIFERELSNLSLLNCTSKSL